MATISIIVPVYKVEPYLRRCLDSLLAQTYRDFEVILVDDGSPDRCPEICDKYVEAHANFSVIHKSNGGLSSARLAGFERAKGTYILFVDSDDYIEPQMVEFMHRAMVASGAELAICGYYTERDGSLRREHLLPYQESIIEEADIRKLYIMPILLPLPSEVRIPGFVCTRMYKRDLICSNYFVHESKVFVEDHVFNLLYCDKVRCIAVVNVPLYHYCIHVGSLSNAYRPNKMGMSEHVLSFYLDYANKHNIEIDHRRIEYFSIAAVSTCVDNAVLSGSYAGFLAELRRMEHMRLYQCALRSSSRDGGGIFCRLIFFLLRFRMSLLVYLLRKARLTVSQY